MASVFSLATPGPPFPPGGMIPDGGESYLCEIYIPHGTASGLKKGRLVLRSGDDKAVFDINLIVCDFDLPDKLSFVPEMNAYSTVSPYKGYKYYSFVQNFFIHRVIRCILL